MTTENHLSSQSIAELKTILEGIHGHPFSTEEAGKIGYWWLGYVRKLTDNAPKTKKAKKHLNNREK